MKQKMARYEMHKYWGKKPSKHLLEMIEKYSKYGDVVLDPFSGYGVFVCEAYLNGRNSIGNDLNPVSVFIQEQLLNCDISINDVRCEVDKIIQSTKKYEDFWYRHNCDLCGSELTVVACLRSKIGYPLTNKVECLCSKRAIEVDIDNDAASSLLSKESNEKLSDHPVSKIIRNGRISALDNMTTDDLFTKRSLACHIALFNEINNVKKESIRKILLMCFTSNLANCSKLVPPIKSRGAMAPGAWMTGFYIGETYIENNVFHYFKNRVSKAISGKKDYFLEMDKLKDMTDLGKVNSIHDFNKSSRGYMIDNQDAKFLNYPDNSIDYIFTDPPYGDTVPYFEQSVIWNTWLDFYVDYDNEVVVSDSKERNKNRSNFSIDISKCINEIWRVLKNGKYFSITFHSLAGEEWYFLIKSCLESGFVLHDIEMLEQKTFAPRQLNRKVTVKGDFLITLMKSDLSPSPIYIGKDDTIKLITDVAIDSIRNGFNTTNDLYFRIISKLFYERSIFYNVNFFDVLLTKLVVDDDGCWSILE